jgi:hypothetical protein
MISIAGDKDSHEDDVIDTLYPMLLDALNLSSEDDAREKATSILKCIRPPKEAKKEGKSLVMIPMISLF